MNCKFALGSRCLVAERIAKTLVTIRTDKACKHCLKQSQPRGENSVTVSLALTSLHRADDKERARELIEKYRLLFQENANQKRPPLARRIVNWRMSIKRWEDAGRPVRSDEEVARIIREYCEPCDYYNKRWRQCNLCGCFCRAHGRPEFNKPKMLTEKCPLDPPKWGQDCIIPGGEHDAR